MKTIYEDDNLLVIDKPAGLTVHEGAGEKKETLVDLIIDRYPEMKKLQWEDISRPGIVHRLDKDTSGIIIVAKNPETQKFLQKQFYDREVTKTYLTLILGKADLNGEISTNIRRDPSHRRRMSISYLGEGKEAKTFYRSKKYYSYITKNRNLILTLLEVKPRTGRMHQIRVHLKHKELPVIGDNVYNTKESKKIAKELNINRQFLHASKIKFKLPNGKTIEINSELPDDLKNVLLKLDNKNE
jgi:23S rRNA pseudouridine1911/1915/1917 synthase